MYHQIANISNTTSSLENPNIDLYANNEEDCLEIVGIVDGKENQARKDYLRKVIKDSDKIIYYLNITNPNDIALESNSAFKNGIGYKLQVYFSDRTSSNEKFKIINASTNEVLHAKDILKAGLCLRMDGEYKIKNINFENCSFELHDTNGKLDVIRYVNQNLLADNKAIITRYDKVKAYYIKAPNPLGNLMYNKTIWAWTITNDTNFESSVEVCYASNDIDFENMEKIVDLTKIENGLSLDDIKHLAELYKTLSSDNMKKITDIMQDKYGLNLGDISVDKMNFNRFIIPSKYTFYRPLNVPFICFGFKNSPGENAVLCTMQILYTVPLGSIGK